MLYCHVCADKAASPASPESLYLLLSMVLTLSNQPPPPAFSFRWHSAVTFSREGQTAGAALFGLSLYLDAHTHRRTGTHTHTHTSTGTQVVTQKIKHIVALPPASRLKSHSKVLVSYHMRVQATGSFLFELRSFLVWLKWHWCPSERNVCSTRACIKHTVSCRRCQHADLNVNNTTKENFCTGTVLQECKKGWQMLLYRFTAVRLSMASIEFY